MWIKLIGANFSANNIGTLKSYKVDTTGLIGLTVSPTSISYETEGEEKTQELTFTVKSGYKLAANSVITIKDVDGASLGTASSSTDIAANGTIKATITTTKNIVVTGTAEVVETGGGGSEGDDDTTDPTPDGTTGLGGTLVSSGNMTGAYLLENSSYASTTYADGAIANDVYFIYDLIPVEPSTTYRLAYGRAYFELDSTGAQIGSRGNLTSGATDFIFTTSSTAAYISVAFKYEEVGVADVKLQTRSFVQTGEALLSTLTSDYNDGYGLDSGSYADKVDVNFYVYKNIPVTGGGTYAIPYARSTWFLDSSKAGLYRKNLTNDVENWTHTVTSDVAYISASMKHEECNKDEAKLITYELQWI